MKTRNTDVPIWDRRRPKTLFSGLMTCGHCGGGFAKVTKANFGCSNARSKGKAVCSNMATISQDELEELVLAALQNNLMDQEALAVFCEEYAKERNRLQATASQNRNALEKELTTVKRDHAKLIDAIIAGIPADPVKDRMLAYDGRRIDLEAPLSRAPAPSPIRIHPKMAETYREKITALIGLLQQPDGLLEAKETLRGLIDRITLKAPEPGAKLALHLEGALAELLMLSLETKQQTGQMAKTQGTEYIGELVFLAGGRFGLDRTSEVYRKKRK